MKKKTKIIVVCFLLVVFFVCGFLCSSIITKFQEFVKRMSKSTTYYSMNNISIVGDGSTGITIPERAWDIYYNHQQVAMDDRCYVAFSADEKEIIKIIEYLKNESQKETSNFDVRTFKGIPTPKDDKGRVLKWWTDMPIDKLEIHSGRYYWLGYDKANSRVYFYTFST